MFAAKHWLFILPLSVLVFLSTACASLRGAQLYQSGTRALDRGEVAMAIDDLERAAQTLPDASEVQNHLGIAYTRAGRFDAALAAYERAVELDCGNAAALWNLRGARSYEAHRAVSERPVGSDPRGVRQ